MKLVLLKICMPRLCGLPDQTEEPAWLVVCPGERGAGGRNPLRQKGKSRSEKPHNTHSWANAWAANLSTVGSVVCFSHWLQILGLFPSSFAHPGAAFLPSIS